MPTEIHLKRVTLNQAVVVNHKQIQEEFLRLAKADYEKTWKDRKPEDCSPFDSGLFRVTPTVEIAYDTAFNLTWKKDKDEAEHVLVQMLTEAARNKAPGWLFGEVVVVWDDKTPIVPAMA